MENTIACSDCSIVKREKAGIGYCGIAVQHAQKVGCASPFTSTRKISPKKLKTFYSYKWMTKVWNENIVQWKST